MIAAYAPQAAQRPAGLVASSMPGCGVCAVDVGRAGLRNDPANENGPPAAGDRACPTCGKPATERHRPFCSKRCADVDLQRWLSGVYVIPAAEDDRGPDDPFIENGPEP